MSRGAGHKHAKKAQAAQALAQALVVGMHGRHVVIETDAGERHIAHARGKKSECVVGDRVHWQPAGDEAVVEALAPRRNLLRRQDEWRTKSFAANLDQLLIMLAGEPMFSESQLTRSLIAAEDAGIRAVLLLNKVDLPAAELARERLAPYRAMGLTVLETALKADPAAAHAQLAPLFAGHTTLILGPSGTGKSTLINLMVPEAEAQTGEISQALNSGRHTTTTSTWYWLDGLHASAPSEGQAQQAPDAAPADASAPSVDAPRRGALIDSPGFQEFGLMHIAPTQLAELMPDLRAHLGGCKFYNCTHRHEPGCGVRAALEGGQISPSRHRLYAELWDELEAGQRPG